MKGYRSKLIPLFSDVIAPEQAMAAKIQAIRAPHAAMLGEELGRTEARCSTGAATSTARSTT